MKAKALTKAGLPAKGIKIVVEGSFKGETIDEKKLIDQLYYAIGSKASGNLHCHGRLQALGDRRR